MSTRAQIAEISASPALIVLGICQPVAFCVISVKTRGTMSAGESTRLAFSVLLTSFWALTLWAGAGILRTERYYGTLGYFLTGVRDPRLILIGKSLGAITVSVASTVFSVLLTFAALHEPICVASPFLVGVGLLLVLASGVAASLMLATVFVVSRHSLQLTSALMYPVFISSGLLIPTSYLPHVVRPVSWILSLTWLQRLLTGAATTGRFDAVSCSLSIGLTCVYAAVGSFTFRHAVRTARREGGFDLY